MTDWFAIEYEAHETAFFPPIPERISAQPRHDGWGINPWSGLYERGAGMSKYPNSGALSKNERKEKDTHPDFAGSVEVDGVEYWISGWKKEGAKGPFISLSFKPKDESKPASKPAAKNQDADDPFGDFE